MSRNVQIYRKRKSLTANRHFYPAELWPSASLVSRNILKTLTLSFQTHRESIIESIQLQATLPEGFLSLLSPVSVTKKKGVEGLSFCVFALFKLTLNQGLNALILSCCIIRSCVLYSQQRDKWQQCRFAYKSSVKYTFIRQWICGALVFPQHGHKSLSVWEALMWMCKCMTRTDPPSVSVNQKHNLDAIRKCELITHPTANMCCPWPIKLREWGRRRWKFMEDTCFNWTPVL